MEIYVRRQAFPRDRLSNASLEFTIIYFAVNPCPSGDSRGRLASLVIVREDRQNSRVSAKTGDYLSDSARSQKEGYPTAAMKTLRALGPIQLAPKFLRRGH